MKRDWIVGLLGLLVAACGDGSGGCTDDLDCIDAWDCTTDVCGAGNTCRNTPVDAVCDTGQTCDPTMGCVDDGGGDCASNDECDDSIMCTNDVCGVGGECMNMPLNERCAMGEVCDTTMGCITDTGCDSAADCDDSIACTNDTCGADRTCNNTPVNEMCDTSMMEVCLPGVGCQVMDPCTVDADCRPENFCDGAYICNTEFGCEMTGPTMCNDGDDCTVDMCDPTAPGEMGQTGACRFDCDSSRPECMCPMAGPTCNGQFSLPGAAGNCAGLFNWDFSNVTFTNTAGVIEVTGWTVSTSAAVPPMADPGPACPDVNAVTGLPASGPGSCAEEYRIMGTFTDDNTFVGTFSATFDGFCAACSMSVPITGSRI